MGSQTYKKLSCRRETAQQGVSVRSLGFYGALEICILLLLLLLLLLL